MSPLLRSTGRRLAVALACLSATAGVLAQSPAVQPAAGQPEDSVIAARLLPGERIVLDGSLAHPAWQRAPAHQRFLETQPRSGAEPPQRTQVQVLFDEQAVYVGVHAFDTQPALIRDQAVRYDNVNRTQDFVVAYIDPIGNQSSAQFFRVNAAGSIADGMHTAADDNEDFSPDFDWDAAVQRRADGWTAVMRIPFASLRFAEAEAGAAQRPWRFMLARRLPREQFHLVLSVDLPRGSPSFIDRLQPLQGVQLPRDHRFLVLRPSLTLRHTSSRPDSTSPAVQEHHAEASLDIKWRPRAELVIDGTIKPDFSQTALDVPQLSGNSRFALFLPEKRPFFFESADLLRSPTDALYTRSLTQPRAGVRASWRSPTLSGVALAADDMGGAGVLLPGPFGTDIAAQPGSRVLLARVRQHGSASGVTVGGLLASRQYEDARGGNHVAGGDVEAALGGSWRLRGQLLGSRTTALPQADGELRAAAARDGLRGYVNLVRQTESAETGITLDEITADFRHDTGFVNQSGTRQIGLRQMAKWQAVGPFNQFEAFVDVHEIRERHSGLTVDRGGYIGWWGAAARNLEWWFEWHPRSPVRTRADGPLITQRFVATGLVMTPASWWPLVDTNLVVGQLADTVADVARPGARWRFSARLRPWRPLELEPSVSQAWLYDNRGTARRLTYHETAAQALAVWHLNARQHLRLIVQRSSLNRRAEAIVTAQQHGSRSQSLTWHWRQSAGTQLFVGASHESGRSARSPRSTEAFVKLQVDVDELRAHW